MKKIISALAALAALTTRASAFCPPQSSIITTSCTSTSLAGIRPDQFGEWMLEDGADYNVQTGPKRRVRPLRVNWMRETTGPGTGSGSGTGNYLSQLQQPQPTAQNNNYNNNSFNSNYPYKNPKVYHYSAQSYRQQDEFINKAQGTNTMYGSGQLERGVPHQIQWCAGGEPAYPARSQPQRYYSREYQRQEEFINKAQGTNRMDPVRPLGGMSHQDAWVMRN